MRYAISLMEESGDREDWQPRATFVADVAPADLAMFEKATLAHLRASGALDEEYGIEYYLWSTPLLPDAATPAEAGAALAAERTWSDSIAEKLRHAGREQWRDAYASAWQELISGIVADRTTPETERA